MPLTRPRAPARSCVWQQIDKGDIQSPGDSQQLVIGYRPGARFDLGNLRAGERHAIQRSPAAQVFLRHTRAHGAANFPHAGANQITGGRR